MLRLELTSALGMGLIALMRRILRTMTLSVASTIMRVVALAVLVIVMTAKMRRISKRFSGGLSPTLYGVGGGTLLN